ncbi:MAG: hypothetical protein Q4G03_04015 [Planctomycetia bacterium]|nr:hypothetical protein [Planctomycetia bacterium]
MQRVIDFFTLDRNYLSAAAMYLGVGLLLLALTPTQSSVIGAGDDPCNGECPEDAVCVGNYETGYYCSCINTEE